MKKEHWLDWAEEQYGVKLCICNSSISMLIKITNLDILFQLWCNEGGGGGMVEVNSVFIHYQVLLSTDLLSQQRKPIE